MTAPVFREPWEAQAFAIVLVASEPDCSTGHEWAPGLPRETPRRKQAAAMSDTGETYYPGSGLHAGNGW